MELNRENQSLLRSAVISFVIAIVVLVLFILPAEYNIDLTGIGEKFGLTVFNEEAKAEPLLLLKKEQQNSVSVTVPAGKGIEYKLAMKKFSKVTYDWTIDNGEVYVDLHGEPAGDSTGYFESYTIATVNKMKGSFTAPFDGSHGWYWRNNSNKDIQIQLEFTGEYVIEGLK